MSFVGVDGESLMMGLNDIVVFLGLVCMLVSLEFLYVLKVIGCSNELVYVGIRFSVGCFMI